MNGMYDVKNNTLLPHSPEYLSTIQLPITYDPDAQCTQIHKFLHEVVDPDDVLVLVQYAGYCCIPDISHQKSLLSLSYYIFLVLKIIDFGFVLYY